MNDKELERVLIETLKMARDTNDRVKKMESRQRYALYWRIFYWVVGIAITAVAAYYFWPYLKIAREQLNAATAIISSFGT